MPLRLVDNFLAIGHPVSKLYGNVFQYVTTVSMLLLWHPLAVAACDHQIATVVSLQGRVEYLKNQRDDPSRQWQSVSVDQLICPGESIRLDAFSRASLHLSNNTFLRLNEKTLVNFPVKQSSQNFWIELQQGIGHFISRITNRFEVSTPFVNAAVDGTEFVVQVEEKEAKLSVIEGTVIGSAKSEEFSLQQGEQLIASDDSVNRSTIAVPAGNSVAWAIYFPPILSLQELTAHASHQQTRDLLKSAMTQLENGRPDAALQLVTDQSAASTAPDPQESIVTIAQAALFLSVGQTDAADDVLKRGLAQDPNQPLAYALKALIAAVTNAPEEALANAQQALQLNTNSAAVYIAYSYADQSAHRLLDARAHAQLATQVDSNNPIGWRRLGELQLVLGNISAADEALQQALRITQNNPQVLTLAGLIKLMALDIAQGKKLLYQSLAIDSANPDTRLGLALAFTREGELKKGREQMEYATSLNPANSVLRSYLGRIYFEEKRAAEAQTQWRLAQQFDPFDPTPYFYEGVQKLFANDPVGAIESLENSKELNANRGVYRSETLLQSDAATRSATLGRVYNELGFDQAVFSEAWEALKNDPTNSDGHRLLADRYSTLPRHEAARTSELLQAQLWQPLSAYPLQPQLSESDTTVITGLGPQRPGLNEYHSLFTRDGIYTTVNAIGGGDSTWGEDTVLAILNGPVALNLGQFHYESDGFRENFKQSEDIYNGLIQWKISPSLSTQFEVRKQQRQTKDFELKAIVPVPKDANRIRETITYRFGLKYLVDSQNSILMSAIKQDYDESLFQPESERLSTEEKTPSMVELQNIFRISNLYTQFGIGQVKTDPDTEINDSFFKVSQSQDIVHRNIYLYSSYEYFPSINLLAGLSYDWFDEKTKSSQVIFDMPLQDPPQQIDKRKWSPKFGISYSPYKSLTFRSAAFRTFKRNIAADQTIEPVQIVGFNQVYDDDLTSVANVYAAAADFKATPSITTGFETIYRNVDVPTFAFQEDGTEPTQKDRIHRVYYYQSFSENISLHTNYLYENLDFKFKSRGFGGEVFNINTQEIPFGINIYLGNIWKFKFELVYLHQRVGASFNSDQQRNFYESGWFTNLKLNYQLPKRAGELQIGIENLNDERKEFIDSNNDSIRYYPKRFIFGRVQFSF